MSGYGDRPFGIREVILTTIDGATQVTLPVAMKLAFKERLVTAELHGDDSLQSVQSNTDAVEWELEAGGIPLEAYGLMTNRTVVESGGPSPELVNTRTARAGDVMPYFNVYGKAIDGTGDIHVLIPKCKLNAPIEGEFADGAFYVTKCSGLAIDDGTSLYQMVQNETADTLPSS
jgi:hypothetical protein